MNTMRILFFVVASFLTVAVHAQAPEFTRQVDLSPLQSISVQHNQTLKTFDSYARQTLSLITNRTRLDGMPAVLAILDLSFRPEEYIHRPLIYIKNVPLRQDMQDCDWLDQSERDRILKQGTVSLVQWVDPRMQDFMRKQAAGAMFKAGAVQQVDQAAATLFGLIGRPADFPPVALVPPPGNDPSLHKWHTFAELAGTVPTWAQRLRERGAPVPRAIEGSMDIASLEQAASSASALLTAWREKDAAGVNAAAASLAAALPQINPDRYPSAIKRNTEVVYNRLAKFTIPGAFIYFAAFVCFVMSARSGVGSLRLWGLRLMVIALLVHTAGIGIRWWLVEKSVESWFYAIPIKNQFESVLFSAWFGALVGLILELRRSKAVFGAAASFVGWLSLVAIFSAPYVTGRQIGAEIGQSAGVLMSYWLYIHVTMAVAAYALIGMSFLLGCWWLIRYYSRYEKLKNVPARRLSEDAADHPALPAGSVSGGAVSLGFAQTLARVLFLPSRAKSVSSATVAFETLKSDDARFLATLDLCNLVVLQLAFWVLGAAIILGAVWADQSWGRPWGWDPKETFALVTWIVYLIIIHVRMVTPEKAWWTAVLSIVGFFVMLFNWIGVNFFLVGLHSYA